LIVSPDIFKLAKSLAVALVGAASIAASPAIANSSAAAVDITEPLRAQPDSLTSGDKRFSQLFASWEALDDGAANAVSIRRTVSIPSQMPLEGARLTSDYGMRTHPVLGKRRKHNGIDLAAPTGTPVYATADGIVGKAQWFSSYGLYIRVDHGADLETRFAHLSKLAVAAGERVKKGDIIGYVGSTGRSTGPHLHYEVRIDGVAVNPIPYMVETQAQQEFALVTGTGGKGGQ
jgi:murein DD-endopeptidase MepM/ murein hydrolase activator NlpD